MESFGTTYSQDFQEWGREFARNVHRLSTCDSLPRLHADIYRFRLYIHSGAKRKSTLIEVNATRPTLNTSHFALRHSLLTKHGTHIVGRVIISFAEYLFDYVQFFNIVEIEVRA